MFPARLMITTLVRSVNPVLFPVLTVDMCFSTMHILLIDVYHCCYFRLILNVISTKYIHCSVCFLQCTASDYNFCISNVTYSYHITVSAVMYSTNVFFNLSISNSVYFVFLWYRICVSIQSSYFTFDHLDFVIIFR